MKKDLLRLADLDLGEVERLFESAAKLKREKAEGKAHKLLEGKALGMLFKKSSTRTRISFEVGMFQLGGHAVILSSDTLQMERGESVSDTAKTFSSYLDGIVIRTYDQSEIEEIAESADIPVINALTDKYHPCQILADLFTIREKKGKLSDVKVAYIGDGNNIANSLLLGSAIVGADITVITPEGFEPDEDVIKDAENIAKESGSVIAVERDPAKGVKGVDVLYTDTWVSMGQEEEEASRRKTFAPYQINQNLLDNASSGALVMHCLPAHRGDEITAEVMDGSNSIVWEQAANRLHVQKAIMALLLG